jgi:hypothetical protein
MAELIVLPSLERLQPYDTTGTQAFGLTFSVALNDAGDLPQDWTQLGRSFLQPWSFRDSGSDGWLPVKSLWFFPWPGGGAGQSIDVQTPGAPRQKVLERALEKRFHKFKADQWQWQPVDGKTTVSRAIRPWPAFLGEVSLYPWPLPQALGLSFFVTVPLAQLPAGSAVVAVPVLRLRLGGQTIDLVPRLTSPAPSPGDTSPVELIYDMVPPPSQPAPVLPRISARTMPCTAPQALTSHYFDFEHLWVKGNKADLAGVDWRMGLEHRLAEQLDLGHAVADWLKEQLATPARRAGVAKSYPRYAWRALVELRKSTLPYLGNGFPGGNLLRRLAPFWRDDKSEPFDRKAADALDAEARPWFSALTDSAQEEKDMQDWVSWIPVQGQEGARRSPLLQAAGDGKTALGRLTLEETVAALDPLAATLATSDVTATLFKGVWKKFLHEVTLSSRAKAFAQALAQRDPMAGVDLPTSLLQSHVGRRWAELAPAFDGKSDLEGTRQNVVPILQGFLTGLGLPAAWAKARSKQMAQALLPAGASSRTLSQQGLTIQLDTLGQDPASADLLQHMQGIGLLARKSGTQEWHCLNLAAARIDCETIADPVLVPSRLAYMDGLRAPAVTYDNGPLTAAGPLTPREVAGTELSAPKSADDDLDRPLIELTYSKKTKIPGLVYGQSYDVLPFLVTNSGALPKEIADPSHRPWALKPSISGLTGAPVRSGYGYRRAEPVGALRVKFQSATGLPPIPPHVAPRLRELEPAQVLPKGDPLLARDSTLHADSMLAGTPLLLLAPKDTARPGVEVKEGFDFKIFGPSVSLQTWDRWVALKGEKDRRKFVWRSFYELAHAQMGNDRVALEDAGVYLDDPAVKGFQCELVSFRDDGTKVSRPLKPPIDLGKSPRAAKAKEKEPIGSDFSNWRTADASLRTEQHEAVQVSCVVDDDGQLKVTVGSQDFVGEPGSKLHRLSIYAVLEDGAESRFAAKEGVRDDVPGITSPWHLLIEVAEAMPSETDLQSALWKALTPDPKLAEQGTLKVGLSLTDDSLAKLRRHVDRVELWHQVWSWRGRPPAPHPVLATGQAPAAAEEGKTYLDFEMAELGERSDDEHRRLPMRRVSPPSVAAASFVYEEDLGQRGPQADLRALHHRFAVRVYSRYEGLLPAAKGQLDSLDFANPPRSRWRRLFVPCRFRDVVPVPKIKLVLPLTQEGPGDAGRGPGLLAVVDGAWYEVGGLAEHLEVEVMTATAKNGQTVYQAGTDPIVTAQSAGIELEAGDGALPADRKITFGRIDGAIGHHRDSSRTAPRFLASSFLLSHPTIPAGPGNKKDHAWWFLKLRFKRTLQLQGTEVRASDFSAPFWVQLLPAIERVESDWFDPNPDLHLDGRTLKPAPKSLSRPPFYLFGLMTRKVVDFAGRPDQEAYVGVWWQEGGSWKTDPDNELTDTDLLRIRWIEVQSPRAPAIQRSDDLWRRLFDPFPEGPDTTRQTAHPDSARARIVRISKPYTVARRPS